jgi:adenosylcobinamide-phosphate synthase
MLFSSYNVANLVLVCVLALLLNLVLGIRGLYTPVLGLHPLRLWEAGIRKLAEKLNRFRRSNQTRLIRGIILVCLALALAGWLGWLMIPIASIPYGIAGEIALFALLLGARPALDQSSQIAKLLTSLGAKQQVSSALLPPEMLRRQQQHYDTATVLRGTIEMLMMQLSERVIAPLLYYILASWVGVFVVLGIAVMDRLLGYRNTQYAYFGTATAMLHSLLQWLPSRITGCLMCLAACFSPAASGRAAWRIMWRDASKTASGNSGWPIAAAAGALNITLGGPRALYGSYIADQWIGDGAAKITLPTLKAAQWLYGIVCLMLLMLGIGIAATAQ